MQKQNSLVEKAKDIAMQEFLDDDTAKRRPDGTDYKNESSRVVELMEQRTESLKQFDVTSILDKHNTFAT